MILVVMILIFSSEIICLLYSAVDNHAYSWKSCNTSYCNFSQSWISWLAKVCQRWDIIKTASHLLWQKEFDKIKINLLEVTVINPIPSLLWVLNYFIYFQVLSAQQDYLSMRIMLLTKPSLVLHGSCKTNTTMLM